MYCEFAHTSCLAGRNEILFRYRYLKTLITEILKGNETMKKIIAVILAFVLTFSIGTLAFAAESSASSGTGSEAPTAYTCPVCGKVYVSITDYNYCLDSHRDPNGYFVCQECGRMYENPDAYVADLNNHKNDKEYICATCGASFRNKTDYNDHLATHNNTGDHYWTKYIGLKLPEIMDKFFNYIQASGFLGTLNDLFWDLYSRVIEVIMNGVGNGGGEAEVAGAAERLDAAIAKLNLPAADFANFNGFMKTIKEKIKDLYANNRETAIEETTNAEAPVDTGSASAGVAVFAIISAAAAAAYVCSKKKA